MQSEALLAGEEVCGKLQADSVESAVGIWGQRRATQLSQQDPSILGAIPDPKHIVNLLRVENQEMQTVKQKGKILHRTWQLSHDTQSDIFRLYAYHKKQPESDFRPFLTNNNCSRSLN